MPFDPHAHIRPRRSKGVLLALPLLVGALLAGVGNVPAGGASAAPVPGDVKRATAVNAEAGVTAASTFGADRAAGRLRTKPVGARLPGDRKCAARVGDAREIRPANRKANARTGHRDRSLPGLYGRVSGNFTGTTDEVIQWAACKWGFNVNVVRAQTAKESWWFQSTGGDFTTDPDDCAPGHGFGVDGRPGECAESAGVQQVRYPYHRIAFPHATRSTAHNLDYALAVRRNCFEGNDTWFNDVSRGREYEAGDLWGCVGAWFSGRWYTGESRIYIAEVKDYKNQRIWTTRGFIEFRR